MKREHLELVREHLDDARKEAGLLRAAPDIDAVALHWKNFLGHHSRFFNTLHGASNASTNGQAKAWHGLVVHTRKTDELLAYLKHARNAQDHGLARTTQPVAPTGAIGILPMAGMVKVGVDALPSVKLVAVTDSGVSYLPPTAHLGQPLPKGPDRVAVLLGFAEPPKRISMIADFGVAYGEQLLAEAEKYVQP